MTMHSKLKEMEQQDIGLHAHALQCRQAVKDTLPFTTGVDDLQKPIMLGNLQNQTDFPFQAY